MDHRRHHPRGWRLEALKLKHHNRREQRDDQGSTAVSRRLRASRLLLCWNDVSVQHHRASLSDDGQARGGKGGPLGSYASCRIDRRRRAKSARRKGLSMIRNSSTAPCRSSTSPAWPEVSRILMSLLSRLASRASSTPFIPFGITTSLNKSSNSWPLSSIWMASAPFRAQITR